MAEALAEASEKQKELKDLFSQLSEYTKKNDIVLDPLIKTVESNPGDESKQKELDAIVSELCQFSISCGDMFKSILDTCINPKTSLVEKMELLKAFGKACSFDKIPEDKIQKYVRWILSHYSILHTTLEEKISSEEKTGSSSKFTEDELKKIRQNIPVRLGINLQTMIDGFNNGKYTFREGIKLMVEFGALCNQFEVWPSTVRYICNKIIDGYIMNIVPEGGNFITVGNTMFPINQIAWISFYDSKLPQVIVKLHSETEPVTVYFNPFDQEVSYTEQKQKIIDKLSNLVK